MQRAILFPVWSYSNDLIMVIPFSNSVLLDGEDMDNLMALGGTVFPIAKRSAQKICIPLFLASISKSWLFHLSGKNKER